MKELSIEQKAKAYDEVREKIALRFGSNVAEEIFSEFEMNEDERIRGAIIDHLKDNNLTEWADWLEKQGEQPKKHDKIEPKFKIGDWVIDKQGIVHQIANVTEIVTCHTYGYDIVGGGYFNDNTEGVRLWTIQDAKDGDVLCCESGWTCIFKTLVNDENFSSYCFMDSTKWFCETGSECHTLKEEFVKAYNGKIYPATKEQRDLLFQKMKEAGYVWDEEMKELKKVEQKSSLNEDEKLTDDCNFQYITDMIERYSKYCWNDEFSNNILNWFKSLKDRIK